MSTKGLVRRVMGSTNSTKLFEGVFAITKPPSISSADVVRDLQTAFRGSKTFTPLLQAQQFRLDRESKYQRNRRREKDNRLKIGHGGTLDPLATGVLIIGIGRGTKSLPSFLHCTKSYTADVLFGAATDTYDILGKVLSKAPYTQITQAKVEEALNQFRGDGMQTPPIYSALSQDGKRLYEYAREGKEPPRAIEQRPVTVEKLELVEWLEGHEYRWPKAEASQAEKIFADKILKLNEVKGDSAEADAETAVGEKRKRDDGPDETTDEPAAKRQEGNTQQEREAEPAKEDETVPATAETSEPISSDTATADIPPAVKIDMTVTSGFYVRSLCNDLGKAVGSHALMASLVRTRQGDYALGENVLDHADLAKGEEVWGPKIKVMLDSWLEKNPDDATQSANTKRAQDGRQQRQGGGADKQQESRRRNSSSEADAKA